MDGYTKRRGKGIIFEKYIFNGLRILNPAWKATYVAETVKEHDIEVRKGLIYKKIEVKSDEYILHTQNIAVQIWTSQGLSGWGQYCDADILIHCAINMKKQVQEIRQFYWSYGSPNGLWNFVKDYTSHYVRNIVNLEQEHPKAHVSLIPLTEIEKYLINEFKFRESI